MCYRYAVLFLTAAVLVQGASLTYTERTQITQSSGVLKFAMKLGGQSGPQETIHSFRDGVMSSKTKDALDIWNLNTGIITHQNLKNNECSEITVDEMAEAMRLNMARLQGANKGGSAKGEQVKMSFKVDVQRPGIKEKIAGVDTELVVITLIPEAEQKDNPQAGPMALGKVIVKSAMGNMPGSDAANEVRRKLAEKLVLQNGNAAAFQAFAGVAEGMKKAFEELASLGQTPMRTTMQLLSPPGSGGGSGQAPAQNTDSQSSRENAAASVLGGLGGRFGRLGRKKTKEAEQPAAEQPASAPATPAAGGESIFLETTTEVVSYSSDVSPALLVKTPGCKEVEHSMRKVLRQSR